MKQNVILTNVPLRSGRDELIWIEIHICMETTQGIALYIYPNLKLAKKLFFLLSYVFFLFSSTKSEKRAEQVLPGGRGEGWPK
jgi:hypothetical protein